MTTVGKSSRQKISKEIVALCDTLGQMDLTDMLRIFYSKAAECALFSSSHGTSSRVYRIFGHKTSLNEFKKTGIISSISSNHNGMKLEINYKNKTEIYTNMWRLSGMLLNHEWLTISRRKPKDTLTQKWKHSDLKSVKHRQSNS